MGTQNPKKGKKHNPKREKPRPGASSHSTAKHVRIRPAAHRDRHRLHHRGRERNRRRRSQHRAHARESRVRGRGHRRRPMRDNTFTDDSRTSQSEEQQDSCGREIALKKPHTTKSQAYTAHGMRPTPRRTRARGPGSSGEAQGVAQCPPVVVVVVVSGGFLRCAVQSKSRDYME